MLLEFTCLEILCFLENDSLKISKKMVLISCCSASEFQCGDCRFKSLIGCNAIPFSPYERKRFHRVPKKKEKALYLAAKGILAEIAQLGERQT